MPNDPYFLAQQPNFGPQPMINMNNNPIGTTNQFVLNPYSNSTPAGIYP